MTSSVTQYTPNVYAKMKRNGESLLRAGYEETRKKPNLFKFYAGPVVFYADMLGTKMVPIWEDTAPLFWWRFQTSLPLWARQNCVYIEWRRLLALGIPHRLSCECDERSSREAELANMWDYEQGNPEGPVPSGLRFLEGLRTKEETLE